MLRPIPLTVYTCRLKRHPAERGGPASSRMHKDAHGTSSDKHDSLSATRLSHLQQHPRHMRVPESTARAAARCCMRENTHGTQDNAVLHLSRGRADQGAQGSPPGAQMAGKRAPQRGAPPCESPPVRAREYSHRRRSRTKAEKCWWI